MNYLETYFKGSLKTTLRLPTDTPDPFVYLISGTLPLSTLIHLRQLSLLIQLNHLGPSHSSYIHAVLTLQSTPPPKWSWWTKMAFRFFSTSKLVPNKPHPFIIYSGTSEFLNHKSSILIKLLCGQYRLNSLKNKFNTNNSPFCQMCTMKSIEDIDHFLILCPYLDGARFYALLLWKNEL